MAFRAQLSSLIDHYHSIGGLSAFSIHNKSNALSADVLVIKNKLMSILKRTIWNQPVRHAGEGKHFSVLQYDDKDKAILLGSDIWKELSLMGSWIQDATILRWAELTAHISKDEIKPSAVIDCLLTVPTINRKVNAAKTFYDALPDKRCVWSDNKIINKYDLDHAIPFSLWKNNDLWNLLPADEKVNKNKKDKLPKREVIKKRQDCIVYYWSLIKEEFPVRFKYETEKIVGKKSYDKNNWENKLFATFAEAVEFTAIQRGVDRWQPKNYSASKIVNRNIIRYKTKGRIETIAIPFYTDLKIACGDFRDGYSEYNHSTLDVENCHGNLDPQKHFIVCAIGNSMDGGRNPISDGDYLLFEKNTGGTISNQLFAIEQQDGFGDTSYIFKRIEKDSQGRYRLVSTNKDYEDIPVDNDCMFPFARFLYKLEKCNSPDITPCFREKRFLS